MDQKLYLQNSYQKKFDAAVTISKQVDQGWEIELAVTCFYPESGGQPCDRGTIGPANVLDVQLKDDRVIHLVDVFPEGEKIHGNIDWNRRYDHMQQHTGQHLLTAALINLFEANTVSFHLGKKISTIDIDRSAFNARQLLEAEQLCNNWIATALPVTTEYVESDEFQKLNLRKKALPDHIEGPVRLIRIGDVDVAHCGGTHLANTAEIQLVKIIAAETVKTTTRLHFLAGRRAIADYNAKHNLLTDLSNSLTCGIEDLPLVIEKQQKERTENVNKVKKLDKEIAWLKASADLAQAEKAGNRLILVKRYDGLDPGELKSLAGQITKQEPRLIFCGAGAFSGKGALVLAAGSDFEGDLGQTIRELLPVFDGRGGGRGNFAQAVGEETKLEELLIKAKQIIQKMG